MSSAARFLLEFEATGDQEVVAKIREVGAAGKQTATELESLQGIQDPFAPVASGAEAAIAPVEGVGTAVTETGSAMTDFTGEADAAATGMEEFGTQTEESGSKTEGFGSAISTMSGSLAAIGGTLGSVISSLFRYQDIQLKVQKAQLTSARATEMSRRAEEGLDKVLATATSNTANIAAARDRLAKAQANMNKLMDQGVTSGSAFEAAQSEVAAAQKNLSAEFAKGGGDISKLTAAMEKSEINSSKMVVSLNNLEKANREAQQGTLDLAFGFTGMAGSIVQTLSSVGKWGKAMSAVKGAMTALPFVALKGGLAGIASTIGGVLVPALGAAYAGFIVFSTLPTLIGSVNAQLRGDLKATAQEALNMFEILKGMTQIDLGPLGKIPLPFTELFTAIVPHLEEYVKKLGDVKGANIETGSSMTDVEKTLKGAIDRWNELIHPVGEGIQLQSRFAGSARLAGAAATTAGEGVNALAESYSEAGDAAEVAGRLQSRFTDSVRRLGPEYENMGDRIVENMNKVKEAQGTVGDFVVDTTNQIVEGNQAFFESQVKNNEEITKGKEVLSGFAAAMDDTINSTENARQALRDQSQALQDEIESLQDVESQELRTDLALQGMTKRLEESNQKLRDAKGIRDDVTASAQQQLDALNEIELGLIDEEVALKASIAATSDSVIQTQRLTNAKLEGTKAALEFISGIDEEKAAFEAEVGILSQVAEGYMQLGDAANMSVDQLKQFIGVVKGSPAALQELASAIQGLADETLGWVEQVKGDKEEVEKVFGEWEISDAFPKEIRRIMSDGQKEFITARAQIERVAETFGPAIASAFEMAATSADFSQFQEFGPKAAAAIEDGFNGAVPPTLQRVVQLLQNPPGNIQEGLPWIQQIITEFENAKTPMVSFINQFLQAGGAIGDIAPQLAGTAEGLNTLFSAMDQVAGSGKQLNLALADLNKVTIEGVGTFAQVGGELIKIPGPADAAGGAIAGLGVDATDAHTKLTALHTILTLIPQITVAPHIDVDTTDAYTKLSALHQALTAINGLALDAIIITVDAGDAHTKLTALHSALSAINSMTLRPIPIKVNNAAALQGIKATQTALNAIKQTRIPTIRVNPAQALSQIKNVGTQLNAIKQTKIPTVRVNNSQALSQINKVKSALNSLKNITRTITYRYRTVGSPPRGAQSGMHERLQEDTLISAHKGERVDINPTGGPAIEKPGPTHTIYSQNGGRHGGGNEIVIPVTLMLDNKVLIRTVRRGLVEEVSGAM